MGCGFMASIHVSISMRLTGPEWSGATAPRGIALAPGSLRLRRRLLSFSRRGAEIAEADSILNFVSFVVQLSGVYPEAIAKASWQKAAPAPNSHIQRALDPQPRLLHHMSR